jgi:hypothetical protein
VRFWNRSSAIAIVDEFCHWLQLARETCKWRCFRARRDPDGGLTPYIQYDSPGTDREPNWLAVPIHSDSAHVLAEIGCAHGQWKDLPLQTR